VPFAVLFIPLNSMIISFGNGVQMETTLPRMLEILLEAKEFIIYWYKLIRALMMKSEKDKNRIFHGGLLDCWCG